MEGVNLQDFALRDRFAVDRRRAPVDGRSPFGL